MAKRAWTREEDERLISCVNSKTEDESWNGVANRARLDRDGKSCWERWFNYLHPGINREPFTKREDAKIIELQMVFDNCWADIASFLPGRTNSAVKNRWNNRLKAAASGPSPVEEGDVLAMMKKFETLIYIPRPPTLI